MSERDKFEVVLAQFEQKINLSESEKSILASKLKYRTYLKNQYIAQEGDVYKYQTLILSGTVRTFYLDDKGSEHIVAFGIENWWVGDICSFATQSPAELNTQCLEKTEVAQVIYEDMEQLYQEIPKLERHFRMIIQKAYGNMTKRIVRNHSLPAKDRYILFSQSNPEIMRRVPQYMIASYLGITKEFLSSIRKQIVNESKS